MTEEQLNLIHKAKDSLYGAKALFDIGLYAFAVSRTYYTMFYLAEALLLEKELTFSKHSAVISAFGYNFTRTELIPNKFHKYLIDAQNLRNIGDYDTVTLISEEEALTEMNRAKEFIDFTEEFIK